MHPGVLLIFVAVGAFAGGAFAVRMTLSCARRAEAEVARLRRELLAERHAAGHDALTGLPNRRTFYCSGSPLVADAGRRPLVAVLVDLDDFKRVNDTLGHVVGDQVLVAVARRFAELAGSGLVARLGGDEFAGLLAWPTSDEAWLRHSAALLAAALAVPVDVCGRGVAVTASVGLAPVCTAAALDDVLCRADAAMYQAKTLPERACVAGADDDRARSCAQSRPLQSPSTQSPSTQSPPAQSFTHPWSAHVWSAPSWSAQPEATQSESGESRTAFAWLPASR